MSYYPNRIAESKALFLQRINVDSFVALMVLLFLSITLNLFLKNFRKYLNIISGMFIISVFLYAAGIYADRAYILNPIARVSFGSGFWISLFFVYVIVIDALKNSKTLFKVIVVFLFFLLISFFVFGGFLDKIDVIREYYVRKSRFLNEISIHLYLSFLSVFVAVLFSFPLGIVAYRKRKITQKIFTFLNVVQTIPSIAMFGALILPLAYISKHSVFLSNLGVSGIGDTPAFIALVLYAMLPLVRNIYIGLKNVPEDVKQASIGMGMGRRQLLFRVELPLALVEILTGVKISLVQTIGNTALAALIGAGGLGVFIFQGLGEASNSLVMLGVLPLVFLAVFSEYAMNVVILLMSKRIYRV